jgi:hypothetical protein
VSGGYHQIGCPAFAEADRARSLIGPADKPFVARDLWTFSEGVAFVTTLGLGMVIGALLYGAFR